MHISSKIKLMHWSIRSYNILLPGNPRDIWPSSVPEVQKNLNFSCVGWGIWTGTVIFLAEYIYFDMEVFKGKEFRSRSREQIAQKKRCTRKSRSLIVSFTKHLWSVPALGWGIWTLSVEREFEGTNLQKLKRPRMLPGFGCRWEGLKLRTDRRIFILLLVSTD